MLARIIVTHLLIVGLVLSFANSVAPAGKNPILAKVIVNVTSDTHKSVIKSYLNRSLRELSDVKIGYGLDTDGKTYAIEVVHMQRSSGMHVLSAVIKGFIPSTNFRNPDRALKPLGKTKKPCWIFQHSLYCGGTDISDLRDYCEEIVAGFDMEITHTRRQLR